MEVREVRPDEYERAGQVVVEAYRALPGEHMSGGYAGRAGRRGPPGGRGRGAGRGGRRGGVVGCVTYVPDPSSPWAEMLEAGEAGVRMLATDPAVQGRASAGAPARRMHQAGHGAAAATGLFLHSTPWMEAAHRLYQRAGFQRVPERDWLPVPDVPLLAFRLASAVTSVASDG